jgi:hypothetical protein
MEGWAKTIYIDKEPEISTTQIVQEMSASDINELVANLAGSYQVDESSITYEFQKINDRFDEDAATCIRIVFYLNGAQRREIFNLKMLLPNELILMAKSIVMERKVL